jgi:hypothetical protein
MCGMQEPIDGNIDIQTSRREKVFTVLPDRVNTTLIKSIPYIAIAYQQTLLQLRIKQLQCLNVKKRSRLKIQTPI